VRKIVVVNSEVAVYFGLLLVKSEFGVADSEKRVAAIFLLLVWPLEPLGGSFLPYSGLYCCRIAHRRKTGCTKSKSVARKYSSETGSTYKSARNVVKLTVIRKTRVKNRCGQT